MFEAPTLQTLADYNIWAALPAIALAFGTMVVLLVDLFLPEERKHWTPYVAISGVAASFVMTLFTYNASGQLQAEGGSVFGGMFVADAFTGFLNITVLATAFVSILLSTDYLKRANVNYGEYYSLLLLSTAGAMFMAGANDLVVIFVALELLSIPLYVLAAFRGVGDKVDAPGLKSEEAGMKYFILGAFSSAFFVYGAALVYGATGTTNLQGIFEAVAPVLAGPASGQFFLLAGAALLLVGLGFKVAVVPFHMWTPDVYEGAPTPITAFMSMAAKAGGFGALLRLMIVGLATFALGTGDQPAAWQGAVQLVAILTLVLGNFAALAQSNMKRMLAYSSIAHAGYIMMAVASVSAANTVPGIGDTAAQAGLVYLFAYMFTNLGAFAVVLAVEKDDGTGTDLEDLVGLANTKPLLAAAMAIFMLSLTGIPLTAGFVGKWLVFGAAVQAGLIPLAIIGVLVTIVSAFYYLRVVVNMYLRADETEGSEAAAATPGVTYAIYAMMAGTLIVGIVVPLVTNLVAAVDLV